VTDGARTPTSRACRAGSPCASRQIVAVRRPQDGSAAGNPGYSLRFSLRQQSAESVFVVLVPLLPLSGVIGSQPSPPGTRSPDRSGPECGVRKSRSPDVTLDFIGCCVSNPVGYPGTIRANCLAQLNPVAFAGPPLNLHPIGGFRAEPRNH